MAELSPDAALTPVTVSALQNSILVVAQSLQSWTAKLPFPGWLTSKTTNPQEVPPELHPTVDLFAHMGPDCKGRKICFDPQVFPPIGVGLWVSHG
jgi:hypothetical protein